eukprot:TRINITY_DN24006_c1_g4_i1.p1 TRINITY_DN24006_c1_g4~~TRINITY_DN24006_c1_g4_i1.p1  ORF type:complete len:1020 (-),score=170.63 TRINITY_DN24006_c1_g4_i1:214-3216(-)
MAEVAPTGKVADDPGLAHACAHCSTVFPSKNKLFAHLRGSDCSAKAAADGLDIVEKREKIALVIGCTSSSSDWRSQLWRAIDVARGVSPDAPSAACDASAPSASAASAPGREAYATHGAPGATFAGDAGVDLKALQCDPAPPRACDVLSFTTEVVASEDARKAWCARANAVLPESIRVLGRSVGLPASFKADAACIRRCYVCSVPMSLLLASAENDNEDEGDQTHKSSSGDLDETAGSAGIMDASSKTDNFMRKKHSKTQHDPGWGDGAAGEVLLGQFDKLKSILRKFQGEHRFHNFCTQSRLSPGDGVVRRSIYRCRARADADTGVTAFSVAADAVLPGQMQAMLGLTIALQRGDLPLHYLDAAFSDEALVQVPAIPGGTEYLEGCVYHKKFHHLLQPLMEGDVAQAFQKKVRQAIAERALSGSVETWYRDQFLPSVPTLREQKLPRPLSLSAGAVDGDETPQALASVSGSVPEIYTDVLRLLREAEASGNWPGISKGREKVIKESTLSENGGGGGSFTVGSMPPPLEVPSGNSLFPELALRAFELERLLRPDRPPSSTLAINKRAQFLPHVDSGAGAGQGISLIVGLGDYSGGELVVEGIPHDIRYKPLDFNGWTQRHWTLPFDGERFSLVWFTPLGCENMPGLQVCAKHIQSNTTSACTAAEPLAVDNADLDQPFAPPVRAALDEISVLDEHVRLRNGLLLPRLGLGTWQLQGAPGSDEPTPCEKAIEAALAAGYQLLDTASIYKNEAAIGAALRRCGKAADKVHITTKVSPYEMGFDRALRACRESLSRLDRKCIDLYLIHWPALPKKPHSSPEHRRGRHETWRALEQLYSDGLVRAIGVSNFTAEHLQQLLEDGVEQMPMVNQVEAHPFFVPASTVEFCAAHDIVIQAYSPLGAGPASNAAKATGGEANGTRMLLENDVVNQIALETGRQPAQVLLRWGLQKGFIVIPRSQNPTRIAENCRIFDFCLSAAQMSWLDALRSDACAQKFCWNPSTVS